MLAHLRRSGAALAALPARAVVRAVRRALTGRGKVVELTVESLPDVRSRALFAQQVRRLAHDPGVRGVLLRVDGPPGAWGSTSDLRSAISEVRASGKRVAALLETPGNAAMWLASACDHVAIVPTGEIGPLGLGVELTFFGSALDNLGVQADFEAAGAYKSFGEPFTRTHASPANREAIEQLLDGLHERWLTDVAAGRGVAVAVLRDAIHAGPIAAEIAVELGLADQVGYYDQVLATFADQGQEPPDTLSFAAWARADLVDLRLAGVGRGPGSVAILHLEGPIVLDKGRGAYIGARKVVELARSLRERDDVRAVVLNISSPGGHALGSDLIWREMEKLGASKPLIACYEDVSASGGVYLSAPARRVFARATTITGSVGVFGGKLVLGGAMRRVGVHAQLIGPTQSAGYLSPSRPFNDAQRASFRAQLQRFYDGFVERVARGRGVEPHEVEPYCRGRVWTGEQACTRHLVDEVGDLRAAVRYARGQAGLGPGSGIVDVSAIPRRTALAWAMQRAAPGGALVDLSRAAGLGALGRVVELLASPAQVLALLPFDLRLR